MVFEDFEVFYGLLECNLGLPFDRRKEKKMEKIDRRIKDMNVGHRKKRT
jgi:hypothetical protein